MAEEERWLSPFIKEAQSVGVVVAMAAVGGWWAQYSLQYACKCSDTAKIAVMVFNRLVYT